MRYVMRTGILATPMAALPSLRDLGTARAQKIATQHQSDQDPRNTNGTVTVGQSAVFTAPLELLSDGDLAGLIVGLKDLNLQPMD
jgi:hypothetical protein